MARGRLANRRRTPTPPSGLPRALLSGGVGGGTMASSQWDQLAGALLEVLPKATCPIDANCFRKFFRNRDRTDLRKHLAWESRATTRGRIKKLELVKTKARQLRAALNKLDERDRIAVLGQIIIAEGRRIGDVSRADVADRTARLNQEPDFLAKLGAIKPREFWKFGPGQPRNLRAYFVLQDAAAIFEWLTGIKAARQVDRDKRSDAGPFFLFASTLWPAIFGSGLRGLSAAMKNWAEGSSTYDEGSALIANMHFHHPAWGVFED